MKRLLLLFIALFTTLGIISFGQDRVNTGPAQLSYKSKEIKKALYWRKDSSTGKWVSRKNNTFPYEGDGVHSDNFRNIFIGEYAGYKYLFLDYFQGKYRYPNIKQEWTYYRYIYQILLTDDDIEKLETLQMDSTYTVRPFFYTCMYKEHKEYSPSFFLKSSETLRSADQLLYDVNKERYSERFALEKHREDYPNRRFFIFKRTTSEGKDVVRFVLYPHASDYLIDSHYFEIDYQVYKNLFTPDKKVEFK